MANISISDKMYEEISRISYSCRTSRKDVADKMCVFAIKRQDAFIEEMF